MIINQPIQSSKTACWWSSGGNYWMSNVSTTTLPRQWGYSYHYIYWTFTPKLRGSNCLPFRILPRRTMSSNGKRLKEHAFKKNSHATTNPFLWWTSLHCVRLSGFFFSFYHIVFFYKYKNFVSNNEAPRCRRTRWLRIIFVKNEFVDWHNL